MAVLRESLAAVEAGECVSAEIDKNVRVMLGGMLLIVDEREEGTALLLAALNDTED